MKIDQAGKKFWSHYQRNYIRGPQNFGRAQIKVGRLYTFKYDAKVAEYWDKYPVSLIIDVQPKYFLGLSIHYLPPQTREFFIKKILLFNYKRLQNNQPVKIDYGMIKSGLNEFYKEGIVLIRKYLRNHVKSRVAEIPYKEWMNAVSAYGNGRWMNTTAAKVWAEYKERLRYLNLGTKGKITRNRGLKKRITKYKPIRGYNKPKKRQYKYK